MFKKLSLAFLASASCVGSMLPAYAIDAAAQFAEPTVIYGNGQAPQRMAQSRRMQQMQSQPYQQPQYQQPQYQQQYRQDAPQPVGYAPRQSGAGLLEILFSDGQQQDPRYQQQPYPQQQPYQQPQYQQQYQAQPGYEPQRGLLPRSEQQSMRQQDESIEPARPAFDPKYEKQMVDYSGKESAGSIVVDTPNKFLYLVQGNGKALRYGIGVGKPGFTWSGIKQISAKKEWPAWTPPPEMLLRRPDLPRHMEGGPDNPLGARAMYLGSSLYRIHGSNEPWTIGTNVSSGCIRMRNEDVIDLYGRVNVGAKVTVI